MITRERVSVTAGALEIGIKLTVLDCSECGVIYAIPNDLEKRARENAKSWYCPNGHGQAFTTSKVDELTEKLKRAENRRQWAEDSARLASERADTAEASLRTTKGHVTRLRKRVVAGACPFGCRRHFADLERHVASKHEGLRLEGESS